MLPLLFLILRLLFLLKLFDRDRLDLDDFDDFVEELEPEWCEVEELFEEIDEEEEEEEREFEVLEWWEDKECEEVERCEEIELWWLEFVLLTGERVGEWVEWLSIGTSFLISFNCSFSSFWFSLGVELKIFGFLEIKYWKEFYNLKILKRLERLTFTWAKSENFVSLIIFIPFLENT